MNPICRRTASNPENEIAVASDAFNGTLLTSFFLLYEYALSFRFSLDHDHHLLVDDCHGQTPFATANPSSGLPNTTRLLRFPTTNDRDIVFCYAGQIYTVGKDGGTARRLTSGPGYTSFSRFSPDGTQIAFTSEYDGNREVYVMPAEGGVPKRLTTSATLGRDDVSDRMGPNNIVMAWENTKPLIVFRSRMRSFDDFVGSLFAVGLDSELPQQLPVPRGGFVSFSPDDSKMAFNRIFREFRTWKHYRGGMADDIWLYDFKTGATENLTNNPAQDICPMWGPDNKIYFISDRDNRMNLFVVDLATKETKQLTHFTDFDIKFPSIGKQSIVFEQAGHIWRYDLATGQATPVPIDIKEDFDSGRGGLVDAAKHIESVNLSPDGERTIVVARGDLFSVPAKNGTPRESEQNIRRARTRCGLVARRKMDCVQLGCDRRERTLCAFAGRQRRAATDHERRRHLLLRTEMVARQQESCSGAIACSGCAMSMLPPRR